jgi:Ca-activated chloride channel family protein
MVNYFAYDYPAPDGAMPFAVATAVAPTPWN